MANLNRQIVGKWLINNSTIQQKAGYDEKTIRTIYKDCLKANGFTEKSLDFKEWKKFFSAFNAGAFDRLKEGAVSVKVKTNDSIVNKDIVKNAPFKLNDDWTPGEHTFDESIFVNFKTGKGIDMILSDDGGTMPGTSIIIDGAGGTGKTTIIADIQHSLQINYPNLRSVCVQSEMKRSDIGYDFMKKPWMNKLKYQILKDYSYEKIVETLEAIFTSGYHFIFLDSFEDVVSKIKAFTNMKSGEAEEYLLRLMDDANEGKNNKGVCSVIFAIQQQTKGGERKGSEKLVHMTTATATLHREGKKRYIEFEKNRRCGKLVGNRLYYTMNENNEVEYDVKAFERELMTNEEELKITDEMEENSKKLLAEIDAERNKIFDTEKIINTALENKDEDAEDKSELN